MLAVEDMLSSLEKELEAAGELENTYIFFTSDNGFLLGEHRLNKQKDRPYEESARVPLIVRGPGIEAGTTDKDLALNTDLVPTFAELAVLDLDGEETDGRSFVPLLHGGKPWTWRSSVLLEGFVGKGVRAYGALRTEDYKYVEYDDGERELYDLQDDPYELENAYESADPSLLEDLQRRLEALRDCSGDSCRKAEDAQ
jgi:N-acetylglucosamine-6-sulfatase